ncbi:MAG: helix-turn-helix domain-containing protein [Patescibacteria group bacterium]
MATPYSDKMKLQSTADEKRVVSKVEKLINAVEPFSVVGIADKGKKILHREIVRKISEKHGANYEILHEQINSSSDYNDFHPKLASLGNKIKNTFVILHFSTGSDASEYLTLLQELRDLHGPRFVPIVLSDLAPVFDQLTQNNKLLCRSLIEYKPFDISDTIALLEVFEKRFDTKISKEMKSEIYKLSGGLSGLIKSLYLYVIESNHENGLLVKIDKILEIPSILQRLDLISKDIGYLRCENMVNKNLNIHDMKILSQFGVVNAEGHIFSPLLTEYIKNKLITQPNLPTATEKKLLEYLQANTNTIVSRDQIAQLMWGEDVQDKYSDWAIDQMMHRLRKRFSTYNNHSSTLTTVKKQGFILKKD